MLLASVHLGSDKYRFSHNAALLTKVGVESIFWLDFLCIIQAKLDCSVDFNFIEPIIAKRVLFYYSCACVLIVLFLSFHKSKYIQVGGEIQCIFLKFLCFLARFLFLPNGYYSFCPFYFKLRFPLVAVLRFKNAYF